MVKLEQPNKIEGDRKSLTFGQKSADFLTAKIGSWNFIILFFGVVLFWMLLNLSILFYSWDPYPFIFLNLILSCISAIQAPIILMSQNRQNEIDRLRAKYDYVIDRKTQRETDELLERLARIEKKLDKLK